MANNYLPTGNEMLSLPCLNQQTAGLEDFTFLHMGYKGLVDIRGSTEHPLIQPFIQLDEECLALEGLTWERLGHWIPRFACAAGKAQLTGTWLAPVEERGFLLRLEAHNPTPAAMRLRLGAKGTWAGSWHCVNEDKEIEGTKHCYESHWNESLVFDMRCGTPMFCFAPMADLLCDASHRVLEDGGIQYSLSHQAVVEPGETLALTLYWGLGFEEVAATTSAKEMLRQGFAYELSRSLAWLQQRTHSFGDEKLDALYNTNLFFCIFFSTGVTLDTEELVLVTSRSPRYYVSAAYWDRDSLLWSFPAILDADPALARRMLVYVFGRQRRNLGVHSRYIDGTVLEPGFELDELMAPVIALERYVDATGDNTLLQTPGVRQGVAEILEKLAARKAPDADLYETFLQPTDDERVYPYITYNNVLVWKALRAIARLMPEYCALAAQAEAVKKAIAEHCVKHPPGGAPFYAWSVDLAGHHDVYDEPPGSLQLLPHYGFCAADEETYRNTVDIIRAPDYAYSFAGQAFAEIGCPHAPHPWVLSIANSLLCGRVTHSVDILRRAKMDNLIACESIDETTGACTTGEAFATCAGFLCHGMRHAIKGDTTDAQ